MITALIHKQDDALIMTAPTQMSHRRKRFTLKELLLRATPNKLKDLHDETAWAHEGKSMGRELP